MNEELKVAIKAETDEFSRQIEKAQDEIEDFGGSSEASMKAFDKAVEGAKKTAKVAFAAVAAARGETPDKSKFKWTLLFWIINNCC